MTNGAVNIDVSQEFSNRLTIHKNLEQNVVVTTEDKLKLCLIQHKERLKTRREWLVPLGLTVSIAATLSATNFRDFLIEADVWQALFILCGVVSFIWLVISGFSAWSNRQGNDIDSIISDIKANQVTEDP